MLVESGNPAHSLADSTRMREALAALETRRRHRRRDDRDRAAGRLRAAGAVPVREVGGDVLQLRVPAQRLPPAPAGARPLPTASLPEPEIHARLVEALGALGRRGPRPAARRRQPGAGRVRRRVLRRHRRPTRRSARWRPIVLYRTLGPTLPDGAAAAAVLWGAAHRCAMSFPESVRRAGFDGEGLELGERCSTRSWPARRACTFTDRRVRGRAGGGSAPPTAASTSRSPSCWTELAALAHDRPPADRRVPVRAVRRRAALVHRQHDHPRPDVAQARPRRRAADQPGRRRAPRRRRRRPGPADDQAGQRWRWSSRSPT